MHAHNIISHDLLACLKSGNLCRGKARTRLEAVGVQNHLGLLKFLELFVIDSRIF
jgi:hypothetical protein